VKRKSFGPLAVSIAVHAVIVVALARMVFTYQLGNVDGLHQQEPPKEALHFLRVAPPPPQTSGGGQQLKTATAKDRAPAPLAAPSAIPTTIPVPISPVPRPAQAAGGTGTGRAAGSGAGAAIGVIPMLPDPRIRLTPDPVLPTTRTPAETIDSIVSRAYGIVLDSAAAEAAKRKPGDWTFTDKDGKKYGWDPSGIHLGKFTLPNALLALLPLNNLQQNPTMNSRDAAAIRFDVMYHGQQQITEDQFRESVKRIRERKEREHQDELKKKGVAKDSTAAGGPGSN
jgi:hypothetical protein